MYASVLLAACSSAVVFLSLEQNGLDKEVKKKLKSQVSFDAQML